MKFFFYSGMSGYPWGGSEDLWSRAATRLVADGHEVAASVKAWPKPAIQIAELSASGVEVLCRTETYSTAKRLAIKIATEAGLASPFGTAADLRKKIMAMCPDLIVVSQGGLGDGLLAMEMALELGIPYVSLLQANSESFWPDDEMADRLLNAASGAFRNYFVAKANQDLFFRQIGKKLENCTIVANPPNATAVSDGTWPETDVELSLACVGRFDVFAKGQDIIFEVLARPQWRPRSIRIHLYGNGMNSRGLRRLAESLCITDKIVFEGHVSNVSKIWKRHHALVMPSRYEGSPLALIEAMYCGRPAICSSVAGIPELIDDGVNGFLAAAPTIQLFEECLERTWNARLSLRRMGEAAAISVRSKFPEDPVSAFANELLSLFGNSLFKSNYHRRCH